jgi:hypothetical protein
MIWILAFIVIAIISFFLTLRSMKDYQEPPEKAEEYGLFHIRNISSLNDSLKKIHQQLGVKNLLFSLEKIKKGGEEALVIYLPITYKNHFKELQLIEIEDYLQGEESNEALPHISQKQISVNESFTSLLDYQNKDEMEKISLPDLNEFQMVGIQGVFQPISDDSEVKFQSTFRVIVLEPDSNKRVELIKKLTHEVLTKSNLSMILQQNNIKNYRDYKSRKIIPEMVGKRTVSMHDLQALLGS